MYLDAPIMPPRSHDEQVTELLKAIDSGDDTAWSRLVPLVHGELRRIASARLAGLKPGQTVCTTELVQATYLKLLGRSHLGWQNRKHFYAAVSQSMRDFLIDEARRRQRKKRGGDWNRVSFAADIARSHSDVEDVLAVDEALDKLEQEDELQFKIVSLRYFAGLTIDAVAETLGVSPSTVDRQWKFARAWLHRELSRGESTGE